MGENAIINVLRYYESPNAIVFSSGHMRIGDMLRAGFALNLMGVGVVTVASYWLMGWVFGL